MITRKQFKAELDSVDDLTIEILHSVMVALQQKVTNSTNQIDWANYKQQLSPKVVKSAELVEVYNLAESLRRPPSAVIIDNYRFN